MNEEERRNKSNVTASCCAGKCSFLLLLLECWRDRLLERRAALLSTGVRGRCCRCLLPSLPPPFLPPVCAVCMCVSGSFCSRFICRSQLDLNDLFAGISRRLLTPDTSLALTDDPPPHPPPVSVAGRHQPALLLLLLLV